MILIILSQDIHPILIQLSLLMFYFNINIFCLFYRCQVLSQRIFLKGIFQMCNFTSLSQPQRVALCSYQPQSSYPPPLQKLTLEKLSLGISPLGICLWKNTHHLIITIIIFILLFQPDPKKPVRRVGAKVPPDRTERAIVCCGLKNPIR